MSDQIDNRPGDIWITVAGTNEGVSPKYFAAFPANSVSLSAFGQTMFAPAEIRLNLTAYVRDMIAEAVK